MEHLSEARLSRATVRALAVQTGPADADVAVNIAAVRRLVSAAEPRPDLVVLPELFANPFWCVGLSDPAYFAWAEGLDGPVVTGMRALARDLGAVVVASFFERGEVAGEFHNSVAVIDRSGELVPGRLPSGREVLTYRKHAVSSFRWDGQVNDEKFYFRPGDGFPTFATDVGRLGVLVCYDRWFPEAWRMLALQGAEVVCVPNASLGDVSDLFVASMRTCAAQNLLYVLATNRAGVEEVEGRRSRYYGLSCIISPRGEVLALAGEAEPDRAVAADLDLAKVAEARTRQTMYRDRRPELYGLLTEPRQPAGEPGGEHHRRSP
ncbi:MAG TPA: nitrilase-related carbon-nitrogen hydrolase [Actinomycetes bacterium]|nr:nitrilase-related carbon-nitrogen hydrolase [Actinomycetes bacterium]